MFIFVLFCLSVEPQLQSFQFIIILSSSYILIKESMQDISLFISIYLFITFDLHQMVLPSHWIMDGLITVGFDIVSMPFLEVRNRTSVLLKIKHNRSYY